MSATRQTSRVRRARSRDGGGGSGEKRGRYARQWACGQDRPKRYLEPPAYATLDEVPRDVYERGLTEKLPWIRRFLNEDCPRGKLKEYACTYADQAGLSRESVPPYSTLNTWVHRYRAFGLLGLMDAVRSDAGQMRGITDEAKDLAVILRVGGKMGPAAALTQLGGILGPEEQPHYSTLRRYIRRYERDNAHLIEVADNGITGFRNRFRLAMAGDAHPGGSVIAFDSTVADIWVRVPDSNAPDGWEAVRPVLTIAEDIGARMLVSFNFSFAAVDSGILLGVLRRVVMQSANYPGLISPGMPRRVVVDKGAEHQGVFRSTLARYGVEITPTPANSPESNSRVERLIGTIGTEVFADMDGYSKTHRRFDPYAPPDWDAKRRLKSLKYEQYRLELPVASLPRIEEVEARVLAWAQVYNSRPHVGLPIDSAELRRVLARAEEMDGLTNTEDEDV